MARASGSEKGSGPQVGEFAGAGLQFAGGIVLFLFLGRWLDGVLGTEPWLLVTGVVVGALAGFYSMYRQLVIEPREKQEGRGQR